jgi:hypothetical protein
MFQSSGVPSCWKVLNPACCFPPRPWPLLPRRHSCMSLYRCGVHRTIPAHPWETRRSSAPARSPSTMAVPANGQQRRSRALAIWKRRQRQAGSWFSQAGLGRCPRAGATLSLPALSRFMISLQTHGPARNCRSRDGALRRCRSATRFSSLVATPSTTTPGQGPLAPWTSSIPRPTRGQPLRYRRRGICSQRRYRATSPFSVVRARRWTSTTHPPAPGPPLHFPLRQASGCRPLLRGTTWYFQVAVIFLLITSISTTH